MRSLAPTPDWLPDWTNLRAYPAGNETYFNWRWEFVRRNAQYQRDWETIAQPHYDTTTGSFGDGDYFRHFRKTFGLVMPIPAWTNAPGNCFVEDWTSGSGIPVTPDTHQSLRRFSAELDVYEIAVVFRLDRPLPPQMRKITRFLQGEQEWLVREGMPKPRTIKAHVDKLPLYLRLLDAAASGAKQKVVAATLFPQDDNQDARVKDGLKAARFMRDRGFRDVPSR